MKKSLKIIVKIACIVLICLVVRLGMLEFLDTQKITEEEKNTFSKLYYYGKLTDSQKEMYLKMDRSISKLHSTIVSGFKEADEVNNNVETVIEAYYNDHPEYYYLPYNYSLSNINFGIKNLSILNLKYLVSDELEIQNMNNELKIAIKEIISNNIKSNMSEYDMELAIHDALVKKVDYYKYEDINNIPNVKHTAYGALVQNEAVCDGYAKAFMLILKELNIDSIIVSGDLDNIAHAWNIVKIDGEYYHVDVTSDNVNVKNTKEVVHTYFNLSDKEITKKHKLTNVLEIPKCSSTKYNYYIHEGMYIEGNGSLKSKLNKIIKKEKNKKVLEVRYNENYKVQDLIDELYNLDFNLWKTKRYTNIEYFNVNDVYFFEK